MVEPECYLPIEKVVFFLGKLYCVFDGEQNSDADSVTIAPALCYEVHGRRPLLIYIFLTVE